MKRTIALALILIGLFAMSAIAGDFRKATWGMTPDEVKAAEEPRVGVDGVLDDLVTLVYEDTVGGLSCKKKYFFTTYNSESPSALVRGRYIFADPVWENNQFYWNYRAIKDLVTNAYGEPFEDRVGWTPETATEPAEKSMDVSYLAQWQTSSTHVHLALEGYKDLWGFYLEYAAREPESAEDDTRGNEGLDSETEGTDPTAQLAGLVDHICYADVAEIHRMIDAGADANVRNSYGYTPLLSASTDGCTETVMLLLAANADANAATESGVTPLRVASWGGHTETVKLLLASNADPNAADTTDGKTPLWFASRFGYTEVVRLLLIANADVDATDTDGVSPLDIASQVGHTEIVRLLKEAGANAQKEVVFVGTPSIRIIESGTERKPQHLTEVEALEYQCIITEIDDEYFWTTRENVELVPVISGLYITFLATNGAGYVRIINPKYKDSFDSLVGENEKDFDYTEHMLLGLTTYSYYGKSE